MSPASAMRPASSSTIDTTRAIKKEHNSIYGSRGPEETRRGSLRTHIEAVLSLSPEDSVPALSTLVSSLSSHLSITGAREVIHPSFCGSYPLNHLAKKWMNIGTQLRESDRPLLAIRQQQLSLMKDFQRLYSASNQAVKQSIVAWLPASVRDFRIGCGCCTRDPLFCVPHDERCDDALYLRPEVWKECFGEEGLTGGMGRVYSKFGSMSWGGNERWRCSEEMMEKAVGREDKSSGRVSEMQGGEGTVEAEESRLETNTF